MQYREAVTTYGSVSAACRAMGIPRTTFRRRLDAEGRDVTVPAESIVPDGYRVKGTSVLYDKDGNPRMSWVKTQIDPAVMARVMDDMREGFSAEMPERWEPRDRRNYATDDNLLTTYILTDYHLGMLAWGEETGADWDIKIAEALLEKYFARAISLSPSSDTAILANIGDLFHFDGMAPVTPTSGHVLDADTRFQKLVRVAIRAVRLAVMMMLEKHNHVHIIHATGNHDMSSAAWLRECFSVFYENDPRITVETRPDPYYCYEHGSTSLFFHHGHRRKVANVDSVFAGKFRDIFGRTKYSYAHLGHLHSTEVKETPLMLVEQHRTLAAPDAYATGGGWLSGRSACAITYDKRYGETIRVIVSAEMLND